jgi:hypothetical protein
MATKYGVRWTETPTTRYEVYCVADASTFKAFPYKKGELARGEAHGRANLTRDRLNREVAQKEGSR